MPLLDAWVTVCWIFGLEDQFRAHLQAAIHPPNCPSAEPAKRADDPAPVICDCIPEDIGGEYITKQRSAQCQQLLDE